MATLHVSEVKMFRQCRRKWDYSAGNRQGLEPIEIPSYFYIGRVVHDALAGYHGNGESLVPYAQKVIKEYQERYEKSRGFEMTGKFLEMFTADSILLLSMLDHYETFSKDQYAKGAFHDTRLKFILSEMPFIVDIEGTEHKLEGRIDGVCQTEDERLWLFETKTSGNAHGLIKSLPLDDQPSVYMYAAEKVFGMEVSGVIYNIMKKKVAVPPNELQNGDLSKAKSSGVTPWSFMKKAREHHGWSDEQIYDYYGAHLEDLYEIQDYFIRKVVTRNENSLQQVLAHYAAIGNEMDNENLVVYPSPDLMNCPRCTFFEPCRLATTGFSPENYVRDNYTARTDQYSFDDKKEKTDA